MDDLQSLFTIVQILNFGQLLTVSLIHNRALALALKVTCRCNVIQDKKAQLSLTNPRDAKACQNCSISTCLQRYRLQYWPIFIILAVVASEICEIPRNSLKIQTNRVQGHPRSSILVSIESAHVLF